MHKIAALLTCHNRKDKTLRCLKHLYDAKKEYKKDLILNVYLTDDGSTDGTSDAVKKAFPEITILHGDGSLFWAKGMNNSWEYALKKSYDGYLLINDDTFVNSSLFNQIEKTGTLCTQKFNSEGVFVGTTIDEETKEITYGGSVITNKFLYKFSRLTPNGDVQSCDLGNANIMYVGQKVAKKIGPLSKGYAHGIADYDYTLKAVKNDIPVLIMPEYNGICEYDHKDLYHGFTSKNLKERIAYLFNPRGLDFKSRLLYMRRFFPYRYPLYYVIGWIKVIFPKFYLNMSSKR